MTCRALTLVIAVLMLTPTASAGTIKLHWLETTGSRSGYPAMTFRVNSIAIRRTTWIVRVSMTNRSRRDIAVVTETSPYLPYRFGLFLPDGHLQHGLPETVTRDTSWLAAVTFAPNLPAVLRPEQTWRGTFAGRGALPRGRLISVTFGVFESPQLGDFSWTTAHAFTL